MKRKCADLLFVLGVLLALLLCLGKALLLPKEINYYENRFADKVAAPTLESCLDGSFQDGVEAGLGDQLPAAQKMKKAYHLAFSSFQRALLPGLSARLPDQYIQIGNLMSYNDYLCLYPRYYSLELEQLEKRAENYAAVIADNPDTEFYLYYVEKDTDIDFQHGQKTIGAYELLRDSLPLEEDHIGHLAVNSFDDFCRLFRRTDHHWNHVGAYQGYVDILSMLAPEQTPLAPVEEVCVGRYSGSKASGRERLAFSEDFYAYRFDFPQMNVLANGLYVPDYGAQGIFLDGKAEETLTYANFYGNDDGVVAFHVPENLGTRGNLLILGDSFDNAILKLLASHYCNTYAVDLRFFEAYVGQPFRLQAFLDEYDVSQVLLVGNIDYFVSDDFLLEE